ncbi:PLP-dependent transferase [Saitoella complicata NRRL Y-17804]|nr:PLP-dependent transferase [Saitoella complicata NRRL Y-17804]ODQ56014.1 PLP-dependent transferase [Saitoella complicata NRRL Y-17804]
MSCTCTRGRLLFHAASRTASAASSRASSCASSVASNAPRSSTTSRTFTTTMHNKSRLNADMVNPHVRAAEYAVRGELAIKAEDLRDRLEAGEKLPFDHVINANIGNPQQLDQKPLTFFRQVIALTECPDLLSEENLPVTKKLFPSDAIERAQVLLKEIGSVGAYSASQGVMGIRKNVAKFLEERDGHPADPADIYLTAGASQGVHTILHILIANPSTGCLIPIPQYPLYTATLAMLNGRAVPYYLDEEKAWSVSMNDMRDGLEKAEAQGTDVRSLVVINPGNPTGNCLAVEDMRDVLRFCKEEGLVLLADEVYQTNTFVSDRPFVSFKKVYRDMCAEDPSMEGLDMVSFHSTSKGMIGECGRRGGYFELTGFDKDVRDIIYKSVSITLCPPVSGQILVDLMVNPPKQGDESYPLYNKEYSHIYNSLKERSQALLSAFKRMEGVDCQDAQGAMYLFPRLTLPQKALDAAAEAGKTPDAFYCLQLLDATGVCMVPGSGFGQKEGTIHLRTTFLAPGTEYAERIVKFHEDFMRKYKD